MNLITFTAKMMWKRALSHKSQYWLLAFIIISLFIVTPKARQLTQLVTLTMLLPAVFLIPGWNSSKTERGIIALISRSDGHKKVKIAQWLFPSTLGLILPALTVWAVSIPPWQFWVVLFFITLSYTILLSITETFCRYQGRLLFSIFWLLQLSGITASIRILRFILFTNYLENVLPKELGNNSIHPDAYVLASLIVLLLTSSAYFYLSKTKSESFIGS